MATVGNLFINVRARTTQFTKRMKSARRQIRLLGAAFIRIGRRALMFGVILGGIVIAAIIAMTKKGLTAVDSITKLARSIGSSTESIVAMQHAANFLWERSILGNHKLTVR